MDDVYVQKSDQLDSEEEFKKLIEECKPFMKEEDPDLTLSTTDSVLLSIGEDPRNWTLIKSWSVPSVLTTIKVGRFNILWPMDRFQKCIRKRPLINYFKLLIKKKRNPMTYKPWISVLNGYRG